MPANIHQPDDKAFKVLLQNQKAFIQLLRTFLSDDWVNQIDEHTLRRLDKSFILPSYKSQESDIIYPCRLKGTNVIFYVLLELQSTVDQQMPWRLLQYMVELWRSLNEELNLQDRRRKSFRLPAIIPIVVYNGTQEWSAKTQFKEYLSHGELFGDAVLSFQYHVFDLKRWTPADTSQLRQLLPLALNLDNTNGTDELLARLQEALHLIRQLGDDESELLQRFIYRTLFTLADPNGFRKFKTVFTKSVTDGKDGVDMVSNISRFMYEEMMAKWNEGAEKGRSEGIIEGIAVGRVEGIAVGEVQVRTAIANSMLLEKLDLELISRMTGFTLEELENLKNKQQ